MVLLAVNVQRLVRRRDPRGTACPIANGWIAPWVVDGARLRFVTTTGRGAA